MCYGTRLYLDQLECGEALATVAQKDLPIESSSVHKNRSEGREPSRKFQVCADHTRDTVTTWPT